MRDHLPRDATRRAALRAKLNAALSRAHYLAVETPLYELDEVFRRGVAEEGFISSSPPPAVRFSDPRPSYGNTGQVVALRVDFTPQIARLWASRLAQDPGPHRLRYEGSVVRLGEALAGTPTELYQVGAELIDLPAPDGDLELLRLARTALAAVGLARVVFDLGHAGFVRRVLSQAMPIVADAPALLEALRRADERAVAAAARTIPDRKLRAITEALPSLRGGVEVLVEAMRLLGTDRVLRACVTELEAAVDAMGNPRDLRIDLGEVRGLGYYTGTRFAAYAAGVGRAIAAGGRYDDLLARFGRAAPAAGFAIELDAVEEARASTVDSPRRRG